MELPRFCGRVTAFESSHTVVPLFVGGRRQVADCRVAPDGVVKALDILEDRQAGFELAGEAGAVNQFTFQGGKEAFAQGVAVAVANGAPQPTL